MRFPLQLAADQLLMRLESMGEVFLGTHAEVGIVRGGKQRFAEFRGLRVLDLQRPRTGIGGVKKLAPYLGPVDRAVSGEVVRVARAVVVVQMHRLDAIFEIDGDPPVGADEMVVSGVEADADTFGIDAPHEFIEVFRRAQILECKIHVRALGNFA